MYINPNCKLEYKNLHRAGDTIINADFLILLKWFFHFLIINTAYLQINRIFEHYVKWNANHSLLLQYLTLVFVALSVRFYVTAKSYITEFITLVHYLVTADQIIENNSLIWNVVTYLFCSPSHEMIFFMTKKNRLFSNIHAVLNDSVVNIGKPSNETRSR